MALAQRYIVLGSAAVFSNRPARQPAADFAVAAANALLARLAVLHRELESVLPFHYNAGIRERVEIMRKEEKRKEKISFIPRLHWHTGNILKKSPQ